MSDEKMPEEMISWMSQKGWSDHHDQWHYERRWDFWHALASQPQHPAWVDDLIKENSDKGWVRSPTQEGEAGNGEDFLFMHRAMFQLLLDNYPQHIHYLRGWNSPPQDPSDQDDPVPLDPTNQPPNSSKGAFNQNMASAIAKIEARVPSFQTDDQIGMFLETNLRPTPENPMARSADPETGLHNYLHSRWSDDQSSINLGDPTVNIFNQRFWKLHGWIDHQWWRFRKAKEFDDADSAYKDKLAFYVNMMNMDSHHHHFMNVVRAHTIKPTRNLFSLDVWK